MNTSKKRKSPEDETMVNGFEGRKKKKNRGNSFVEEPLIDDNLEITLDSVDSLESEEQEEENGSKDSEIEWEIPDLITLVSKLEKQLPKHDTGKYKTTLDKINWNSVTFGTHTPEDCKKAINAVLGKVRKYRTLSEMLVDANQWAQNPHKNLTTGRVNHPDKPKKPMTPYLRFYMEKRSKYQEENPQLNNAELSKLMAAQFKLLSEKKQKRYRRKYEKEMAEYKEKIKVFRQEHPDLFKKNNILSERNGPAPAKRPIDIYMAKRLKKYPEEERKAAQEQIRETWNNLSDEKKLKWINKAVKDKERYEAELEQYIKDHPDYKQKKKRSNLSKSDLDIKYKSEGRPDKPPTSGYMLFSKTLLHELPGPAKAKMGIIAQRWKEMSDAEKAKYNDKAHKSLSKYSTKFEAYFQNLSEEEKAKVLPKSRKKEKEPVVKTQKNIVREKVVKNAAKVAYQMEELNRLKVLHPGKADGELITTVNKNWNALDEAGKAKYVELAESLREFLPGHVVETVQTQKHADEEEFIKKSGIKRPPKNGFALFCSERMPTLEDIIPKERMKHIANLWKTVISTEERDRYVEWSKEKNRIFQEQVKRYKETGEIPPSTGGSNPKKGTKNNKKTNGKGAKSSQASTSSSTNADKSPPKPSTSRLSAQTFLYKDSSDESDSD